MPTKNQIIAGPVVVDEILIDPTTGEKMVQTTTTIQVAPQVSVESLSLEEVNSKIDELQNVMATMTKRHDEEAAAFPINLAAKQNELDRLTALQAKLQ